jgi:hypothetical protein
MTSQGFSGAEMSDTQSTNAPPPTIDEDELRRLNQEMIVADLITSDRLLVDLALVKDYNIGALLSMRDERPAESGTLYGSLLEGLSAYQARKFDDIAHYFPQFGVTNAEIRARQSDPRWGGRVLHSSPITPFMKTLRGQIAVNVNHSTVIGKRDPIDLTINTYPLHLGDRDRHIVGLFFAQELGVRVAVVRLDPADIKLSSIIGYDEIYTYHFRVLMDHEDVRAGYTALKFIRKRLFVPRLFGDVLHHTMDTEQEERVIQTRFDILTLFKFFPTRLCSTPSPPVAEEKPADV